MIKSGIFFLPTTSRQQRHWPKSARAGLRGHALLDPLGQHQALGGGEAVLGEEVEEGEIVPGDLGAHGLDVEGGAAGRIARLSVLT